MVPNITSVILLILLVFFCSLWWSTGPQIQIQPQNLPLMFPLFQCGLDPSGPFPLRDHLIVDNGSKNSFIDSLEVDLILVVFFCSLWSPWPRSQMQPLKYTSNVPIISRLTWSLWSSSSLWSPGPRIQIQPQNIPHVPILSRLTWSWWSSSSLWSSECGHCVQLRSQWFVFKVDLILVVLFLSVIIWMWTMVPIITLMFLSRLTWFWWSSSSPWSSGRLVQQSSPTASTGSSLMPSTSALQLSQL